MGLYCLCIAFKHCTVHGDLKRPHLEIWKFPLNSPEVMGSTWQVTVTNQEKTLGYKTGTERVYFSKRVYIRYACAYTCISFTHGTMFKAQTWSERVRPAKREPWLWQRPATSSQEACGTGLISPSSRKLGTQTQSPDQQVTQERSGRSPCRATPMASIWKPVTWGTHVSHTAFPCPSRVSRASPRAQRRLLTMLPRALTVRSW